MSNNKFGTSHSTVDDYARETTLEVIEETLVQIEVNTGSGGGGGNSTIVDVNIPAQTTDLEVAITSSALPSGNGVVSADVPRVVIASDNPTIDVNLVSEALAGNLGVNLAATDLATNIGAANGDTQRVTLAIDQPDIDVIIADVNSKQVRHVYWQSTNVGNTDYSGTPQVKEYTATATTYVQEFKVAIEDDEKNLDSAFKAPKWTISDTGI